MMELKRMSQFEQGTDGSHAVVNAARSETALGDFKAAALAQQDVASRHAHVLPTPSAKLRMRITRFDSQSRRTSKWISMWPCGASL